MQNVNAEPKIYVACLVAYHSGHLHGIRIDANQSADTIFNEINGMLKNSPVRNAEKFVLHDYEGFNSIDIEEYENIEWVSELGQLMATCRELFAGCYDYLGDIEQAKTALHENYIGEFDSEGDFAYELYNELYQLFDRIFSYLNYDEAVARYLFSNDYFSLGHKFHVFKNY